jgi:hypothetical protein
VGGRNCNRCGKRGISHDDDSHPPRSIHQYCMFVRPSGPRSFVTCVSLSRWAVRCRWRWRVGLTFFSCIELLRRGRNRTRRGRRAASGDEATDHNSPSPTWKKISRWCFGPNGLFFVALGHGEGPDALGLESVPRPPSTGRWDDYVIGLFFAVARSLRI